MLFPARAGVILFVDMTSDKQKAFPRACGGDPLGHVLSHACKLFSPRVRG